ncbi:MAG: hypothetical protein ACE5PV_18830 [Candidatus Poribacteria bacterium]
MAKEELLISTMHDITLCQLGDIEAELERLEELVVKRDLLRTWTQHPEGLELFGEELAEAEAEIAENSGRKKMLERQRDWYQRRHDWLDEKLQMYRDNDEGDSSDFWETKDEVPF